MNYSVMIFAFVASCLPHGRAETEVPHQEACKQVFFKTLENLNRELVARKIPAVTLDPSRAEVWLRDDERQEIVEADINPEFSVQFIPGSFSVSQVARHVPRGWLGSFEVPPKPTWTAEQAIKESKFWYEALVGKLPGGDLGVPVAEFTPQLNSPTYRDGAWTVTWLRIDAHGHPFIEDKVSCILYEKWGPRFLSRHFISEYAEGQKVEISAEQAIQIAIPAAQDLLKAPLTSSWSNGYSLNPDAKAELLIVNPNHLLKYKKVEEVPYGDLTARLVWQVKCQASNGKEEQSVYIYLWIDTVTKEVIGGDFNDR